MGDLDWYHLKQNLYKVGGVKAISKLRLCCGRVMTASALLINCRRKQARNFCAYLSKHRRRIVNYSYYQAEQLSVHCRSS